MQVSKCCQNDRNIMWVWKVAPSPKKNCFVLSLQASPSAFFSYTLKWGFLHALFTPLLTSFSLLCWEDPYVFKYCVSALLIANQRRGSQCHAHWYYCFLLLFSTVKLFCILDHWSNLLVRMRSRALFRGFLEAHNLACSYPQQFSNKTAEFTSTKWIVLSKYKTMTPNCSKNWYNIFCLHTKWSVNALFFALIFQL